MKVGKQKLNGKVGSQVNTEVSKKREGMETKEKGYQLGVDIRLPSTSYLLPGFQ